MDLDILGILGVLAPILTATAAYVVAYLQFSGQIAKVRAEAEAAKRDDKRDDFATLVKALQDDNKGLRDQLGELRGATDARISQLERDNAELRREVEALRANTCAWWTGTECRRPAKVGHKEV